MVKKSELRTDVAKAVGGLWVEIPHCEGLAFKVGKGSQKRMRDFLFRHREEEWNEDQATRAYVGGELVTDVRGLEDDSGQPVKWSEDYGIEFFTESEEFEHPVTGLQTREFLRDDILQVLSRQHNSTSDYLVGAAGNSSTPSGGATNTEG